MSDFPNETEEWIAARLGKVTASRISDVVGRRKDGQWMAGRRKYMMELLAERFTGMRTDSYMSPAMLWGKETQAQAEFEYLARIAEFFKGGHAHFVDHPTIPMTGCSPDLFVGEGLAEFKCPETNTHVGYLLDAAIPEDYLWQMHWQMACLPEWKWCDFVSFDPRLPKRLRMLVVRVHRDPKIIAGLEKMVIEFLSELSRIERSLNGEEHLRSEDV